MNLNSVLSIFKPKVFADKVKDVQSINVATLSLLAYFIVSYVYIIISSYVRFDIMVYPTYFDAIILLGWFTLISGIAYCLSKMFSTSYASMYSGIVYPLILFQTLLLIFPSVYVYGFLINNGLYVSGIYFVLPLLVLLVSYQTYVVTKISTLSTPQILITILLLFLQYFLVGLQAIIPVPW